MANYIRDLTNQKFNHLTAIEFIGIGKTNSALWKFKCDCGKEKIIRGALVTSNRIKSCGCKKGERESRDEKKKEKNNLRCNNKSGYQNIFNRKDGRYNVHLMHNGIRYTTTKRDLDQAIKWLEEKKKGLGITNENQEN